MPVREYRPKPVQAIQWIGEPNCLEVFAFLGMEHPEDELDHSLIYLGESAEAKPGDWIIRDPVSRSLTVLDPVAFAATYDPT